MSDAANTSAGKGKRVLLHACCGPCSLEPVRIFEEENISFSIDYYNPNIHPRTEYERRLKTIEEHVTVPHDIDLIEGTYEPQKWEEEVAVHGKNREARCRACYRMRLEHTAREAAARGFDAICTTLTISPYQFTEIILEELQAAADKHSLQAECRDFSDRYAQATQTSRQMGMYRQNYCGCRFSIIEAEQERAQRKARREREKRIRHRALIIAAAEGAYTQQNQV